MKTKTLSAALLLLAACQSTLPEPPTAPHEDPGRQPLVMLDEPGAECSPIGATTADDCNTCRCTEEGWTCTTLDYSDPIEPQDAGTCTPGHSVFVPSQRDISPPSCDVMPPDCERGTHLGSGGICYLCIPDGAPWDRESDCVCNDDGHWLCTER